MENWNEKVKKVCVILSSSRSGSSVFKKVLQSHPDVVSLDGELEPLLILTKNGFPFNSDSDAFDYLDNKSQLLDLLLKYLRVPHVKMCSKLEIIQRWTDRFHLQFPESNTEVIGSIINSISPEDLGEEGVYKLVLDSAFKNESWKKSFYDNFYDKDNYKSFDENKIEEPPFVLPSMYTRTVIESDLSQKVFLFKTPQDAYRQNLYKELFPNADITYIHLTRGYAQTVNGLIDGWISPVGFFNHNMSLIDVELSINNYSESYSFGKKWWKFDLPPNWKDFIHQNLIEVCLNQWIQSHKSIISNFPNSIQIKFEDFLRKPTSIMSEVFNMLSLDPNFATKGNLPLTMITDQPTLSRWRKRESELLQLYERKDVQELMSKLGYGNEPETWI